jgi:hypothetical protein
MPGEADPSDPDTEPVRVGSNIGRRVRLDVIAMINVRTVRSQNLQVRFRRERNVWLRVRSGGSCRVMGIFVQDTTFAGPVSTDSGRYPDSDKYNECGGGIQEAAAAGVAEKRYQRSRSFFTSCATTYSSFVGMIASLIRDPSREINPSAGLFRFFSSSRTIPRFSIFARIVVRSNTLF